MQTKIKSRFVRNLELLLYVGLVLVKLPILCKMQVCNPVTPTETCELWLLPFANPLLILATRILDSPYICAHVHCAGRIHAESYHGVRCLS
jgi:hypothetical protein